MANDTKETPVATKKPAVGQRKLLFFGPGTESTNNGKVIQPPNPDDVRHWLDRKNPQCPFAGYIGNDSAVKQLCYVIFAAHLNADHNAGPNGLALIGPASTGKTTLARCVGRALGTTILGKSVYRVGNFPFVECDRSIRNADDLLGKMKEALLQAGTPLVSTGGNNHEHFKCPPMTIYFDEAQALAGGGSWLLKATERQDAMLITGNAVVDCKNVLWIISTTHRGKLPKALDTRFNKIMLYPYTLSQVTDMVQGTHGDLPVGVCRLVAGYGGRIPREALDFAEKVKLAALFMGSTDYVKVCRVVGQDEGVDEEGLNRQHHGVLVALYNNRDRNKNRVPMAISRLANQVSIEQIDLEEYVLPVLQVQVEDHLPLIRTCMQGIELTDDGIRAMVRRGMIPQIGPDAGKKAIMKP